MFVLQTLWDTEKKHYYDTIEAAFSTNHYNLKFYKAPNGEHKAFYFQACELTLVNRQKGTISFGSKICVCATTTW